MKIFIRVTGSPTIVLSCIRTSFAQEPPVHMYAHFAGASSGFDGSNVQNLVAGLESAAGKMYWTDYSTGPESKPMTDTTLVTLTNPHGLALDVADRKLGPQARGSSRDANLDGSSVETLSIPD